MDHIKLNDPNVQAIQRAFVQNHPELLDVNPQADARNLQAVYGTLFQNGWELSLESMEAAYAAAKQAGWIDLSTYSPQEIEAFEAKNPDTGKHLMTTARMREYLEKTRPAPPPPASRNLADLLPSTGGRAMDTILGGQK